VHEVGRIVSRDARNAISNRFNPNAKQHDGVTVNAGLNIPKIRFR